MYDIVPSGFKNKTTVLEKVVSNYSKHHLTKMRFYTKKNHHFHNIEGLKLLYENYRFLGEHRKSFALF